MVGKIWFYCIECGESFSNRDKLTEHWEKTGHDEK